MKFTVMVCHQDDVEDKIKWCDQGVAGKARLICFSISVIFLALTIILYIMEKSLRYRIISLQTTLNYLDSKRKLKKRVSSKSLILD